MRSPMDLFSRPTIGAASLTCCIERAVQVCERRELGELEQLTQGIATTSQARASPWRERLRRCALDNSYGA